MNIHGLPFKLKYYSFTVNGIKVGHIGVGDRQAVVIYNNFIEGKSTTKVLFDNQNETAEEQAQRYVREHFDSNSEFFDDPVI